MSRKLKTFMVCYVDDVGGNKWLLMNEEDLYYFLRNSWINQNGELIYDDIYVYSDQGTPADEIYKYLDMHWGELA